MTNEYIDGHFTDIVKHGSDIESRGDDSDFNISTNFESKFVEQIDVRVRVS